MALMFGFFALISWSDFHSKRHMASEFFKNWNFVLEKSRSLLNESAQSNWRGSLGKVAELRRHLYKSIQTLLFRLKGKLI